MYFLDDPVVAEKLNDWGVTVDTPLAGNIVGVEYSTTVILHLMGSDSHIALFGDFLNAFGDYLSKYLKNRIPITTVDTNISVAAYARGGDRGEVDDVMIKVAIEEPARRSDEGSGIYFPTYGRVLRWAHLMDEFLTPEKCAKGFHDKYLREHDVNTVNFTISAEKALYDVSFRLGKDLDLALTLDGDGAADDNDPPVDANSVTHPPKVLSPMIRTNNPDDAPTIYAETEADKDVNPVIKPLGSFESGINDPEEEFGRGYGIDTNWDDGPSL